MGCEVLQTTQQNTTVRRPVLFRTDLAQVGPDLSLWQERIVAAGFDGIELDIGACRTDGTSPLTDQQSQPFEALASSKVRVGAMAARCSTTDSSRALEEVGSLLRKAARVRATCLNLTLPPVADVSDENSFAQYQQALNFAYALLHHARFDAEATGVAIALEAGAGRSLLSPVELREIIDASNSWAVGACIDVDRIARIGCPVDWINTLRHRVHAVRLSATRPTDPADETGQTSADNLDAVAGILGEIAYKRPVIVAGPDGPEDVSARITGLFNGSVQRE